MSGARGRSLAFDAARGLAMLAVIVGHTAIRYGDAGAGANTAVAVAFSFHLPVFFVVSGYFMHVERPFAWAREARALLVPYVVAALAIVAGICASNLALHDLGSTRALLKDWLNAALFAGGDIPAAEIALWPQAVRIGALWFLPALFWVRALVSWSVRRGWELVVVPLAFVVGLVSSRYLMLPFDFQSGACAAPFVLCGVYLRRFGLFRERGLGLVPVVCLALIWLFAIARFNGWGMAMCAYGDTPADVLRNTAGGIAGALCVLQGCYALERAVANKGGLLAGAFGGVATIIGQNTLLIMCVHVFEDDVLRWGSIIEALSSLGPLVWVGLAVVRCVVDVAVAWLLKLAWQRVRVTVGVA